MASLDEIGDLIDSGTSHDARTTLGDDFDVTSMTVNWADAPRGGGFDDAYIAT
jgi:hypothetical protein